MGLSSYLFYLLLLGAAGWKAGVSALAVLEQVKAKQTQDLRAQIDAGP